MENGIRRVLKVCQIRHPSHAQEKKRNPLQEHRIRNDDGTEEHKQREHRVLNTIVVILEENFDNFDLEADIIQDESLESVQRDEGESSLYIFDEHEEYDIS
jgi:hypothetical protein